MSPTTRSPSQLTNHCGRALALGRLSLWREGPAQQNPWWREVAQWLPLTERSYPVGALLLEMTVQRHNARGLRVEAFAPIAYFPQLAVGQQVTVTPEAPLDQSRPATIRVIDRVFDAATATFGLRMELDNADLSLPAGLRCTLSFP